ncbi:MAG TPA: hypothetical protein ENI80_11510 [Acidiferrobacteraceae bacterium]|nr:hypothetical protein [Acidiferrobacteraceae bacterium]
MNNRWLLLLLSIFSVNAQSFQPSIEIIEQFDDVKLVAFINEADIENYPLWHPLTEAPPLSVNKAIQSIKNLYKTNRDHLLPKSVKEVELRKISRHEYYWHYLVKIKTNNDKKPKYQIYVVLMNGKVIPALIETESYK